MNPAATLADSTLGRDPAIGGVGNVLSSNKAALAVGVQDPRRGNLYPQVVDLSGTVQRLQRPACAMRGDGNGWLAASLDHAGSTNARCCHTLCHTARPADVKRG